MCASANDLRQEIDAAGEDSDEDSDTGGDAAYYRPISAYEDSGSDTDGGGGAIEPFSPVRCNDADQVHRPNPNPNPNSSHFHAEESAISALDLNGFVEDHDDEEEREREREVSISRALMEDESRRSAPLTPENAARVRDAMRGVSFRGIPPAWADCVPDDRWVDQLRRLRG